MSEMKVIISAAILAVAILLGGYFHAQSVRYELGMMEGAILRIDRQTGDAWNVRNGAWVQIAEATE